jgi:threonyl-tRNA synthetase
VKGAVLETCGKARKVKADVVVTNPTHLAVAIRYFPERIVGVLDLTREILGAFGFYDYQIYLSTRPEKAIGEPARWVEAENSLRRALALR